MLSQQAGRTDSPGHARLRLPNRYCSYQGRFVASRPSKLVFNETRRSLEESQAEGGEQLYQSDLGVPLLWVFAFGERNVWNPGDDIKSRGGAVGNRNPYETQVEVATVRLEHAESALASSAPLLWPWLSAMAVLRRKLYGYPKTGFIRIVAPWMLSLKDAEIDRWRAATAFAENCVNFLLADRNMHASQSLRELKPFCPFVPLGSPKDLKAFQSAKGYEGRPEAMRIALMMLGEPENWGPFEKAVERDVEPAIRQYHDNLETMTHSSSQVPILDAGDAGTTASPGLLGKITGIFKKK